MLFPATKRQILSCLPILCGSFLYGCKVGFIQTISEIFSGSSSPIEVNPNQLSWVTSISYSGTIINVIVFYNIKGASNHRKWILSCLLIFAASWALILVTSSVNVIIFVFFFYGLSGATLITMGHLYMSEVCSPQNREILICLYSFGHTLGMQIEYMLSWIGNYRLLSVFPLFVCVLSCACTIFMKDSPYYLVSLKQESKSIEAYLWFNFKSTDEEVQEYLVTSRKYTEELRQFSKHNSMSFFKENLKPLFFMIVITIGSNYNCDIILSQYGSLIIAPLQEFVNIRIFIFASNCIGIFNSIMKMFTVRWFDRRKMLLGFFLSGLIQHICSLFYYSVNSTKSEARLSANVIIFLLLADKLWNGCAQGAASQILRTEVFPYDQKQFYYSIIAFINDATNFIVLKSWMDLSSRLGIHNLMFSYAIVAYIVGLVVYYLVNDTKGKSLYQIRYELNSIDLSKP